MIDRLIARFSRERTTWLLGLVRLLLAALLLKNTLRLLLDLQANGYFGDVFHVPVVSEAWVPGALGYRWLLAVKLVAAGCALVGLWSRPMLLLAASIGLYLLACDRLQYHNNRYTTHLIAFLIAWSPCDRSFRLPWPRQRGPSGAPGPLWAARLAQLQMSAVYLTSGGGKLLDDDWRGGLVMLQRFSQGAEMLLARGVQLPAFVVELLRSPWLASLASKCAIATELFLAIGLWLPATRILALWLGVMFHLGIQVSAHVDLFSWLMLSGYLLFATPELRERSVRYDPRLSRGRVIAGVLPYLDWLRRFRLVEVPLGRDFEIEERDGRVRAGPERVTALCRAIPCLFPLWPALALRDALVGKLRRAPQRTLARVPE